MSKVIAYVYRAPEGLGKGKGLSKKNIKKLRQTDHFNKKELKMARRGLDVLGIHPNGYCIIVKERATKEATLSQIGYYSQIKEDDEVEVWDLDNSLA